MIQCQIAYAHHYVPTGKGDQMRCIWCNQYSPSNDEFMRGFNDGMKEREAAEEANAIAEDLAQRRVDADYDPLEIIS